MAKKPEPKTERPRVLATVARLVTAADGDTLYRDVYLRRASELLAPFVTEAQYASAVTSREHLDRLLARTRSAVAQQNWLQVRELGAEAADLQRSLATDQESLAAAAAVYGAPTVALDPLSPGLTSSSKRWTSPAQARSEVTATLAELAREDSVARDLYTARQRAIDTLTVPGVVAPSSPTGSKPATNVEQQVLQALERGDAAAIQGLADSMLGRRAGTEARREEGAPTARAQIVTPGVLREPLPEASLPRAKALGLEHIEATLASPEVSASITDFVAQYALGASAATFDRAKEGVARVTVAAEVSVPRDIAAIFAETISLFALHLYVNSAGVRYVPLPAPREVMLVETHGDGEEPVTPLLRELGFGRRRGLARDDIEAGLRKNGARVVAEHLGLDPLAFRIVCIPPDVFTRVGLDRGWGRREEWTHFDGYQVISGGRLRALVGGNARFGGLADLCSISRDDARENTVARFAVIRRERFGVRIG